MKNTFMFTDDTMEEPLKFCDNYLFYAEIYAGMFYNNYYYTKKKNKCKIKYVAEFQINIKMHSFDILILKKKNDDYIQ